ncbi:hypothetical protein [Pseudoalteromonas sp. L1]|uniref:hypothetical protein n=1 Tax=Pseudoalteromonas sp. L1 TaxID=195716 RepID=UPI001F4527B6|nr:hypothetical protein [Pseudoalteromonas sp. L1]
MTEKDKLTEQLKIAESELASWYERDARRQDGSQRQDQIHERIGRDLQQKVYAIKQEISKLD